MQRIGHHLAETAVRLHGGGNVKGLHGNLDLVEVLFFQQADFPKGGGHHVIDDAVVAGLGLAGFGQAVDQVHVAGESAGATDAAHRGETAEVHADADGDVAFLGGLDHFAHLVGVAKVAGIEAQAVHAAGGALQGQLVMEVDIGNQGNVNLLLDLGHCLGGFHVGHRRADDFTTRLFQLVNLAHGGLHVAGVGFSHGLDGNVGATANFHTANVHGFGNSPFVVSHGQHRR